MKHQKPKISLNKKSFQDLENELDGNLNINNEIKIKASNKVLNTLLSNHLNTETNKLINKSFNLRGTINLNAANKSNIFSNKKYTKKELRKTMSGFFNMQKRASISNFREQLSSLNNSFDKRNIYDNKKEIKSRNYITYDDLYFEDDMFIPESSSFPNENEQDFLLKLQFIEDNDYNEDIVDYSIRNNSVSFKVNNRDNIHLKYFYNNNKIKDKKNNKNNSLSFKIDNLYFDEKENIGKNILYIDTLKRTDSIKNTKNNLSSINSNKINNNLSIKKDMNETNISYININLLIKKIAMENFRTNNPYILKCFLQQFKYFIPLDIFLNKIILAFNYYYKSLKKICSELIFLLDEIVMESYEEIILDKKIPYQLKEFFEKIKNIKFDDFQLIEHTKRVNYLLNKYSQEQLNKKSNNKMNNNNPNINKNSNSGLQRKNVILPQKSKSIYIPKKSIEIKEKSKKHKYNYFYIFDYTKEEIAAYLTIDSYQLISDIPEEELFNKKFCSKSKETTAPNIMKIIKRADNLILFIIEDICSYDHKSQRVEIIEKWLRIALVLMNMKNFNDLIMINTLFCNYLFKKMKLTWNKLSKKFFNYIDKLNKFCSGNQNYINIRKEISKCKGAYVPYLGILLKEIMGIEEMKYILENNNINILKLVKLNKVISHFFEFKNNKYSFDKSKNLEILSNLNPSNSDEIEEIIKKIEPKLIINSKKGDKKRLTKTDVEFYK